MKRLILILSLVSMACVVPAMAATQVAMTPTAAMAKPTAMIVMAVVTADSLHVRTEPMGLRIGYLYNADPVTLTGSCRSGWAQIVWKSATAWVKASYLSENICQTSEEQ